MEAFRVNRHAAGTRVVPRDLPKLRPAHNGNFRLSERVFELSNASTDGSGSGAGSAALDRRIPATMRADGREV
jgi:hypothetical protein